MANFGKIPFKGLEQEETLDIRKQLGNYLYYSSTDLAGSELGRKIYYSTESVELTEQEVKLVNDAVDAVYKSYVIRQAIKNVLT